MINIHFLLWMVHSGSQHICQLIFGVYRKLDGRSFFLLLPILCPPPPPGGIPNTYQAKRCKIQS